MATVITSATSDTPAVGGLFAGLSFFLIQRIPLRSHYASLVQANGGRVVRLEAQADHVIADHARNDPPPGSLSYRFINASIDSGELADPADHSAGRPSGAVREVGSVVPAKSTRTPFTPQEDRQLWDWVENCKAAGGSVKGNEIYKQMESQNPRHPFQAWRDRYIKKLMGGPAPSDAAPNVAKSGRSGGRRKSASPRKKLPPLDTEYTQEDFDCIMPSAEVIISLHGEQVDVAWGAWSAANPDHTAEEWKYLWEEQVKPEYLRQIRDREREAAPNNDTEEDQELNDNDDASGSLKRKRTDAPEETARDDGEKKRKLSTEENGGSETASALPLLTSHVASSEQNGLGQGEIVQEGALQITDDVRGDRLTEANLASQQAQHRGQLLRGADLHADDEQHDQSDYVDYLQSLQPTTGTQPNGTVTGNSGAPNGDALDLPTDSAPPKAQSDDFQRQVVVNFPNMAMASQEEIDETLQNNLEWPSSPQARGKADSESQDLPYAPNEVREEDFDFFSSQPFQSQGLDVSQFAEKSLEHTPYEANDLMSQPDVPHQSSEYANGDETPRPGNQRRDENDIDLTIAEPDGGFDPSSSQAHSALNGGSMNGNPDNGVTHNGVVEVSSTRPLPSNSSSHSSQSTLTPLPPTSKGLASRRTKALDTQDILSAETQVPDFDMPLPSDPELDDLPSDPFEQIDRAKQSLSRKATANLRTQQSQNEAQALGDDDVEAFMERLKARHGYDDDVIIDALQRTSMRPQLTEVVLLYQKLDQPLPADVRARGVWSPAEDVSVESGDAGALRRLETLFGWDECAARMKFLEDWRGS